MMKKIINTPNAPQAIGPYSQAVKTDTMIFVSGQIPLKPDGTMLEGGIEEQTRQVMENLKAVVEAGGSEMSKIVKCTIFLADFNNFTAVNEVYKQYFPENPPARATVEVSRLPKDVMVEIEAVAVV